MTKPYNDEINDFLKAQIYAIELYKKRQDLRENNPNPALPGAQPEHARKYAYMLAVLAGVLDISKVDPIVLVDALQKPPAQGGYGNQVIDPISGKKVNVGINYDFLLWLINMIVTDNWQPNKSDVADLSCCHHNQICNHCGCHRP